VGRQSTLHKENSGFATPTLGWHISTFCGYQILFSIIQFLFTQNNGERANPHSPKELNYN
jgi:hypothetical protein